MKPSSTAMSYSNHPHSTIPPAIYNAINPFFHLLRFFNVKESSGETHTHKV